MFMIIHAMLKRKLNTIPQLSSFFFSDGNSAFGVAPQLHVYPHLMWWGGVLFVPPVCSFSSINASDFPNEKEERRGTSQIDPIIFFFFVDFFFLFTFSLFVDLGLDPFSETSDQYITLPHPG